MRRALLLIVGLGIGGLLLLALCVHAAAQYSTQKPAPPVLPVNVEGTALRAVELTVYEGPFWEDGTADEVVDIAALVVENTGEGFLSEGAVILDWGEDRMVFEFSWLPPGSRTLVLEKNRKPFCVPDSMRCYGWASEAYPGQMGAVTVVESGDTELSFANRTTAAISNAAAMFKHYDAESGMYIGGITYAITAGKLQPGEICRVTPWRYVSGYSRVVCVVTEYE